MPRASIECCNKDRKATRTWLFSSLEQFEYEILFEAYCPNCKLPVLAHCYVISAEKGSTKMIKIPRKFHSGWLARKNSELLDNGEKDYRFIIFASKATLNMARDIALKPIWFEKSIPQKSLVPC